MCFIFLLFFKKKTAYEMRISDWSSDVCSSDLSSVLRFRSNSQDQLKRNRYYRLVRWMERRLPEQHRYWHALPAVSLLPPICPVESPSARRVIRRQSPFRFSGQPASAAP